MGRAASVTGGGYARALIRAAQVVCDLPFREACGAILPVVLEKYGNYAVDKLALLAVLSDVTEDGSRSERAQALIQRLRSTVFRLGLPDMLECCSGDLADLKVKSCDIEAWSPRQQKYFEVCSCSNLGDAQARRLRIRVRGADGKLYLAHTLNNTVVAPPRMLIAFLENHLQADGSVTIPEVLRPYMGGKALLVPSK